MTTRMVHPEHGATHAYGQTEIDYLRNLGWSVEGEPAKAAAPAEVAAAEAPAAVKRKPGRPPKAK